MIEPVSGTSGTRALRPRARILRTFGDELTDTLPDLVVDQQLVTLPREHMDGLERLASMDSPFDGALLAWFTRCFGYLGTDDLIWKLLLPGLQSVASHSVP